MDYVFTDKPSGCLTHRDQKDGVGFVEYLGNDLRVVHRLDKETSGAMVFAKTEESASALTEAFTQREVQKTYYFLTDRKSSQESFVEDSEIDGKEAETHFELVKTGFYDLWKAEPKTGRTHQIRKHAKENGLNILGDSLYGGSPAERLMLHCHSLKTKDFAHTSALPLFFEKPELLENLTLAFFLHELDRRQRLFANELKDENATLRMIHGKEKGYNCDKLGEALWFYRFTEGEVSSEENEACEKLAEVCKAKTWYLRQMHNRGKSSELKIVEKAPWVAHENGINYSFKADQGWSPGLFLDQKTNRAWLREKAKGKTVLNLFCYTAGFSVNAAMAGAKEVVSVDVSQKTLDWAKENFTLNKLNPEEYEFWAADARFFLKGCQKRGRKFDYIICDPPSFGRSKNGVFRIEKDLPSLLESLLDCLEPKGELLFSTNYEKWTGREFRRRAEKYASSVELLKNHDWSLRMSNAPGEMKALLVKKD